VSVSVSTYKVMFISMFVFAMLNATNNLMTTDMDTDTDIDNDTDTDTGSEQEKILYKNNTKSL
jgi:hypothetical protein